MIKLDLTIDEVNVVLASLGKQAFEAVATVIQKIQQQAGPQAQEIMEKQKDESLVKETSE
jgi:LPS sulfotransferase NodH